MKSKNGFCLLVAIMTFLFMPTGCSIVEQSPNYVLDISESSISIATIGGTAVVAVTASEPWGAVPDQDSPWCSLALNDTRLTVICTANKTGSYRKANITVSTTSHKSKTLYISQSGS